MLLKLLLFITSVFFVSSFIHSQEANKATTLNYSNQNIFQIPDEVYDNSNVKRLNLSNNGIQVIPQELAKLQLLEELDLSNNPTLDMISLGELVEQLPNLKRLNISNCNIGILSSKIGAAKKIEYLDISNNAIQILPSRFKDLSSLKYFNISNNNLQSLTYCPSFWWKIEDIDISNNPDLDVDRFLFTISYFSNLNKLTLGGNSTNTFFKYNAEGISANYLKIKNVANLNIESPFVKNNIENLHLENCTLSEKGIRIVQLNKSIKQLVIENGKLQECSPVELEVLKLINVKEISFKTIKEISNLPVLDVSESSVSDGFREEMSSKKRATKVIYQNKIISPNEAFQPPLPSADVPFIQKVISSTEQGKISTDNMVIEIPANAFSNVDRSPYVGEVTIEYREFFDPVSTTLAGVPMTFTGGDGVTKQFLSAGMFEVNAKDANGNNLKLSVPNSLSASINNLQPQNNNQLFKINPDTKVWEFLDSVPTEISKILLDQSVIDSINALPIESLGQLKEIRPLYYLDVQKDNERKTLSIEFTKIRKGTGRKEFMEVGPNLIYNNKCLNEQQIVQQQFIIDTISAKAFYANLREIEKKTMTTVRYLDLKNRAFSAIDLPRMISKIALTPNHKMDNFILAFDYMGEKVSVPVSMSKSSFTDPIKEVKEIEKFSKKLYQAQVKQNRSDTIAKKKLTVYLKKEEKTLKERKIQGAQAKLDMMVNLRNTNVARFNMDLGTCNLDILRSMYLGRGEVFVENSVQKYEDGFADEKGKRVDDDIAYVRVIDFENNTAYRRAGLSVYYIKNDKSYATVFFKDGRVGLCNTKMMQNANGKPTRLSLYSTKDMEYTDVKSIILQYVESN